MLLGCVRAAVLYATCSVPHDVSFVFCTPHDAWVRCARYLKAAQKDHLGAMVALAACYNNGVGFAFDPNQAAKWYRKAADLDDQEAQYQIGVCYDKGSGVDGGRDEDVARTWYEKAAKKGHVLALYAMATCYQKTDKEALAWLEKAADAGHAEAQYQLGLCLEIGEVLPRDEQRAVHWYKKAAHLGHPESIKKTESLVCANLVDFLTSCSLLRLTDAGASPISPSHGKASSSGGMCSVM
jgi:TPR repeat protein